MKMMIVIQQNASKKVVYHSTVKNDTDIIFDVEDFFEQCGKEVRTDDVEEIAEKLVNGDTALYDMFHFEMIEL